MAAPHDPRAIVELACRAPSVHNTQPWRWRSRGTQVELYADRSRRLDVSDPDGRNLIISCGAALHHFQVAALGLGHRVAVSRFPDPRDPDLLAAIEVHAGPGATPVAVARLEALRRRRTDRRRFTSWPVPEDRLELLAAAARSAQIQVAVLAGSESRPLVEQLVEQAIDLQQRAPDHVAEQRRWIERSRQDGVPRSALPAQDHPSERRDRFHRDAGRTDDRRVVAPTDGLLGIATAEDDDRSFLATGEALSELWLGAELAGLSVVPLSQVVEVDTTRHQLNRLVLPDTLHPQLLLRIGWLPVAREPLPLTPRRPVDDVLTRGPSRRLSRAARRPSARRGDRWRPGSGR